MPFTPASLTREILKNRHKVTKIEEIKKISLILFDLAIINKEAAEALLEEKHRFLSVLPSVISKEKLLKFARANSPGLVEKLIRYANLDSVLASEMRHVFVSKPKNNELNAFLTFIREQEHRGQRIPQQDGRTFLALRNNAQIAKKHDQHGINIGAEFIPIVTRGTRDFNQKLCSAGSSSSRETLLLDPKDIILQELYAKLKSQLRDNLTPEEILKIVKKLTQSCFPRSAPEQFIKHNLDQDKQVISLSEFILHGQGVCRHHTLLNSYFLSRLASDGVLHGEVIHHRQDFNRGAHTWSLYRDHKNGKLYSLDSLWNDVTCVTDNPGALNRLYRQNVEAEIHRMHFANKSVLPRNQRQMINLPSPEKNHLLIGQVINNFQNWELPQDFERLQERIYQPRSPSLIEKIDQIKSEIEKNKFGVGNYCFFRGGRTLRLDNGQDKRVPHRVYEIYEAIKMHGDYSTIPEQAKALWVEIQKHAEDGINNPRSGQQTKTTTFYSNIANYEIKEDSYVVRYGQHISI